MECTKPPATRADWDALYPGDRARAAAHAELDRIFTEKTKAPADERITSRGQRLRDTDTIPPLF